MSTDVNDHVISSFDCRYHYHILLCPCLQIFREYVELTTCSLEGRCIKLFARQWDTMYGEHNLMFEWYHQEG